MNQEALNALLDSLGTLRSGDDYALIQDGLVGRYLLDERTIGDFAFNETVFRVYTDTDLDDNVYDGTFTGELGIESLDDFLASEAVQDGIATEVINAAVYDFFDEGLDVYIGQELNGVLISVSGVAAAILAFGLEEVVTFFDGDKMAVPTDSLGLTIYDYLDDLEGIDIAPGLEPDLSGNDLIIGSPENDHLFGGMGDDTIDAGAGNDDCVFYAGAAGDYLITFVDENTVIVEDLLENVDGDDGRDTLIEVEKIVFTDADVFTDDIDFGEDDVFRFGFPDGEELPDDGPVDDDDDEPVADDDEPVDDDDDEPVGDDEPVDDDDDEPVNDDEPVDDDDDDDPVDEVASIVRAGTDGSDDFDGGAGDDILRGLGGDDTISGLDGEDKIRGDDGDDVLEGGAGKDTLVGNDGDDTLKGGDDEDCLFGGDGNDCVEGEGGNDVIVLGAGDDKAEGGDGNDKLFGEGGNDNIDGNEGMDVVRGGGGDDVVEGGAGRDKLHGGDGDDTINGGEGNDLMKGGEGADCFVVDNLPGYDRIFDFEVGVDRLDFTGIDPGKLKHAVIEEKDGKLFICVDHHHNLIIDGLTYTEFMNSDPKLDGVYVDVFVD